MKTSLEEAAEEQKLPRAAKGKQLGHCVPGDGDCDSDGDGDGDHGHNECEQSPGSKTKPSNNGGSVTEKMPLTN